MNNINKVIDKKVTKLAKIFQNNNKKLYVVGGFLREYIINKKVSRDYDICSNVSIEEISNMLKDTEYKIIYANKKLNVLKIKNEDLILEYARFRKENYDLTGSHFPKNIEFVNTINRDYKRRDFSINAIYYDIIENKFIDPACGIDDINNRIIKSIRNPEDVLKEDSERILRMIRFSIMYDFSIDKGLLKSAKNNSKYLKNLSNERFSREYNKILLLNKDEKLKKILKNLNLEDEINSKIKN